MKINWKFAFQLTWIGLFLVLAIKILLPNFLNKPLIARQNEGKTVTGSMNRAQQAYYLENNKFSTSIEALGLGIKQETNQYIYKMILQPNSQSVMNIAQSKHEKFKSYVGLVYSTKVDNDTGETITYTKLCETSEALSKLPQMPEIPKNSSEIIKCPSGFKSIR
jgi:hypothetical protein